MGFLEHAAGTHGFSLPSSAHLIIMSLIQWRTEYIKTFITGQESHYLPGNHHASHFKNVLLLDHNHLLTTGTDDRHFDYYPGCTVKGVECNNLLGVQKSRSQIHMPTH